MKPGANFPSDPKDFIAAVRVRADEYVSATFSREGSMRHHRNALGMDILAAPLNVVLAPLHAPLRLNSLPLRIVRLSARRHGSEVST